ncbi:MAG: rRNA methyltransferase [Bacilli bacterium]|uniref:rRNA methyltransferase n=1 Tax=Ureibacillus suwonensis TaxID=313007 RepID=A0ABW0RGR2_9BACL|nr:rRNA methyltransferase [Bacilli bacterium]
MWKLVNGKLLQTIDTSRIKYKTRISKALLDDLKIMADKNNTYVGYLLENGFENILKENAITFDKKNRPKDRVEFRTTCDKELLERLKKFAKDHQLNLNDVIEASVAYINTNDVKQESWRYRVEYEGE